MVPKWHHLKVQKISDQCRKRITARVPEDVRDTLETAAELLGTTVNQFMVHSAYFEAQRLLQQESTIHLARKDTRTILALLDNPPKPTQKLKSAVKKFKATVRV